MKSEDFAKFADLWKKADLILGGLAGVNKSGVVVDREKEPDSIPLPPACPSCRRHRMDMIHDTSGRYYRCPSCRHEYPPRQILI